MDPEYIGITELSKRTGLSSRTLRKWVHDSARPLPAYLVGGKLLFRFGEVARWIERFRVSQIDLDAMADELMEE